MSTRSDTRDRWRRILQQQRASGLAMILDGIDLASVKRVKRYHREERIA